MEQENTILEKGTIHNFIVEGFRTYDESGLIVYTRHGVIIADRSPDEFKWVKVSQYKEHVELKDLENSLQKTFHKKQIDILLSQIKELRAKAGES